MVLKKYVLYTCPQQFVCHTSCEPLWEYSSVLPYILGANVFKKRPQAISSRARPFPLVTRTIQHVYSYLQPCAGLLSGLA